MPYVSGFLIEGPVDPSFGRPGGGHRPADPGYGIDLGAGIDNSLPAPPPGVFPPPIIGGGPIVPAPPGTPPGVIWPPLWSPVDPGYGAGRPLPPHIGGGPAVPPAHVGGGPMPGTPPVVGGGPATPPARPDNTLPSQVYWVVVGVPGIGWRYCAIDPSLSVGGGPVMPGAQPK